MPDAEKAARCESVSEVKPFDSDQPLRCLLVAPHFGYRHYAAFPFKGERFWTWDDKHPEFPCVTADCPGDARYNPPGRGHFPGCRGSLPRCHRCGWTEPEHDPRMVLCHIDPATRVLPPATGGESLG